MATQRPTRSRFSSPHVAAPTKPSDDATDVNANGKPKTLLDRWIEPPIPTPRPSFAEAGIERHGVVANMAALGTRPSAKVLKGVLRQDMADAAGRARRRDTSVASTPAGSIITQTPEPAETKAPTPTESIEQVDKADEIESQVEPTDDADVLTSAEPAVQSVEILRRSRSESENTEDDEPPPPRTPQAQPLPVAVRTSLPNHSPASMSINPGHFPLQQSPAPVLGHYARPTPPYPMRPTLPLPQIGPDGEFTINLEKTDKVIEAAVQRAVDEHRWPTAYALRTLYDDFRGNSRIVRMIEASYGGFATPAQQEEFNKILKHKKTEGRIDRNAEYYFNGDGSDPLPQQRRSSRPPGSFSTDLAQFQVGFTAPVYHTPYSSLSAGEVARPASAHGESVVRPSSLNQSSVPASPHRTQPEQHHSDPSQNNDHVQPQDREGQPDTMDNNQAQAQAQAQEPDHVSDRNQSNEQDHEEHTRKKQKRDDRRSPDAGNATDNMEQSEMSSQRKVTNGSTGRIKSLDLPNSGFNGRSRFTREGSEGSLSSFSSLSMLSDRDVASAFNSPEKNKHPSTAAKLKGSDTLPVSTSVSPNIEEIIARAKTLDTRLSLPGGGYKSVFGAPPSQHISPYTSANNFAAVAAETLVQSPGANNLKRPITAPSKTGPKTFTFSTRTSTTPAPSSSANNNLLNANRGHVPSSSSTTKKSKSNSSSMAPVAVATSTNNNSSSTTSTAGPAQGVFKVKTVGGKPPPVPYDANDKPSRLKRKAREVTDQTAVADESFERHQVQLSAPLEVESDADSIAVKPSKRPPKVRLLNNRETRTRQTNYESEDNSSPTLLGFHPDIAPGSQSTSRAGTPNTLGRPTRKPKTGTGLRVKTSPMKKKGGGTLAGIPRPSGERNSPTGGINGAQDDNDDYCSSCGGNGDLVCCDGCTRSFHFKCVDPPMVEGSLPDEWYCNVCESNRNPVPDDENGLFGPLNTILQRKNPMAFHLPKHIQDYFENVKAGPEGDYEESAPPKPKNRAGWEEQPDSYRTKDSKGKSILCYTCSSPASAPGRAIIQCTLCALYWHLDCLPTPMAKEPAVSRQWRCPLHVDDLLADLPLLLAPAHRFRRIKGAPVVKPALSRGIRNNGHIEVVSDTSDNEEGPTFFEQREYGRVYKLPERGIKLDFIAKVKQQRRGDTGRNHGHQPTKSMEQRSMAEQQAALNIAALATHNPEMRGIDKLVSVLLRKAPKDVLALICQADASALSRDKSLSESDRNLLTQIRGLLDETLSVRNSHPMDMPNGQKRNKAANITPPPSHLTGEQESEDTEMSH